MEELHLTGELEVTKNNLADIIGWLKKGHYVVIYDSFGRFFHKCSKTAMTKEESDLYMDSHRFIYVNVSKIPGLLDDGEWNWYIKDAGFDECTCSIKNICSTISNAKYKTIFRI